MPLPNKKPAAPVSPPAAETQPDPVELQPQALPAAPVVAPATLPATLPMTQSASFPLRHQLDSPAMQLLAATAADKLPDDAKFHLVAIDLGYDGEDQEQAVTTATYPSLAELCAAIEEHAKSDRYMMLLPLVGHIMSLTQSPLRLHTPYGPIRLGNGPAQAAPSLAVFGRPGLAPPQSAGTFADEQELRGDAAETVGEAAAAEFTGGDTPTE